MSGDDKIRKPQTTWNVAVASVLPYLLMLVLTLGADLHFEISVIMREQNAFTFTFYSGRSSLVCMITE